MNGTPHDDQPTVSSPSAPHGPYGGATVLLRVPTMAVRSSAVTRGAPAPLAAPPTESAEAEATIESIELPGPDALEPLAETLVFDEVDPQLWHERPQQPPPSQHRTRPFSWQPVIAAACILAAAWLLRPAWQSASPGSSAPSRGKAASPPDHVAGSQPPAAESPPAGSPSHPPLSALEPMSADQTTAPLGREAGPPGPAWQARLTNWSESLDPRPLGGKPTLSTTSESASLGGTPAGPEAGSADMSGTQPAAYPVTQPETSAYEYPAGQYQMLDALLDRQ